MSDSLDSSKYYERRHEYILKRRESLNEATFKLFSIYQASIAALFASQFLILKELGSGDLAPDLCRIASIVVLAMVLMVSLAYVVVSIGGVSAWIGYRREEREIEAHYGVPVRKMPRMVDVFKWFEFYLLCIVVLIGIGTGFVYEHAVFPLIK